MNEDKKIAWFDSMPRIRRFFITLSAIFVFIILGQDIMGMTKDSTMMISVFVLLPWGIWWIFFKKKYT